MTTDGGEPGLDVPVAAVGPRRDRRRAGIVAVGVTAMVGGAIALAAMNRSEESIAVLPTASSSQAAAGTATPISRSPQQALPAVDNVPLVDPPTIALIVRAETDAEVMAWTPGDGELRLVRTFPNAYDPTERDAQYVMLSPDGRLLAAFTERPTATVGGDRVRIVTEDGISWEHGDVTADTGLAWFDGSARLAIVGGAMAWVLGDIDELGRVRARDVTLGPAPSPDLVDELQVAPIGFSIDGQSIIVGRFNEVERTVEPAYRLDFGAGSVEALDRFPGGGAGGLTAAAQEFGFVDPIRGRTYAFPDDRDGNSIPLTVLDPGGAAAFEVDVRSVVRAIWDDFGRLAVLEGEGDEFPMPLRLLSVAPDGRASVLFETPPVARAALLGVRAGYAGLAIQVDEPRRTQLVLVPMAGGQASGVEATGLGTEGPDGAGWLP